MKRKIQLFSDGQKVFMSGHFSLSFSSDSGVEVPTLIEEIDISDMSDEDYRHGLIHSEDFQITENEDGSKSVQRLDNQQ